MFFKIFLLTLLVKVGLFSTFIMRGTILNPIR